MAGAGPDRTDRPDAATTDTPVWLKVLGIVLLIGVIVVVVVIVATGIDHGPRLHGAP